MPPKTDHAAATAKLALSAANAAAKAAAAAAAVAQEQCVAVARLEEKQTACNDKFDTFYVDWRAHSTKIDSALENIAKHKHDEYISGNKFWGGVGTSLAAALAAIGISVVARK